MSAIFTKLSGVARYAWFVLGYNLLIIVWGAFVRASRSGDGCGSHWPQCHGEVIPTSPTTATVIEFTHRLSSGVALILLIALVVMVLRRVAKPHPARRTVVFSLIFILTEALIGAVLVKYSLVAENPSLSRAFVMSVHLVNTFILLFWLTLTAWYLSGGKQIAWRTSGIISALYFAGLVGITILGVSGAVAALGDTLFPAGSLAEAMRQDLSPASHILLRLRILHPTIALLVTILVMAFSSLVSARANPTAKIPALFLTALVLAQLGIGLLNVALLAPVWLQLVHLLVADLTWLAFILTGAAALATAETYDSPPIVISKSLRVDLSD